MASAGGILGEIGTTLAGRGSAPFCVVCSEDSGACYPFGVFSTDSLLMPVIYLGRIMSRHAYESRAWGVLLQLIHGCRSYGSHDTVDKKHPAGPQVFYTAMFLRVTLYEVMQGLYHQK